MPSLERGNADLVAVVAELRRRVADLERLRSRPSPGCTLQASNGAQAFAGTSTVGAADLVTLSTIVADTGGMADGASGIVVPVDGVYLVSWQTGAMEQSADYGVGNTAANVACRDLGGAEIPGTLAGLAVSYGYGRDRSHAAVCPLTAGTTVRLFFQAVGSGLDMLQNPAASWGIPYRFRLSVVRLHDRPAA